MSYVSRETTPSDIRARAQAFADHEGIENDLDLSVDEEGEALMTDELLAYTHRHGLSLDWLICGETIGIVAAHARRVRQDNEVVDVIRKYDDVETGMLHLALKAHSEGADFETAINIWRDAVDAHRRKKAA